MCVGLGYNNEEHQFSFPLLPAGNLREAVATSLNLQNQWEADALIVALDIPLQEQIINHGYLRERKMKYVGVFPVEADPLCTSWSMVLMQMDKSLVISEFGTKEAQKVGVNAEHLLVGVDIDKWVMATPEEKVKLRGSYGFDEDTFVVLTVADNQERKNLTAAMDMFAEFSKDKENVKYILVTREHNRVGWKLRDYATEIGINGNLLIFERGMSHTQLWTTYAISDVFLLTSKAEGLGLPLLEAMAVGLPCIATNCTGMKELLSDGRGYLISPVFVHRDCFGNGRRYWIADENSVSSEGVEYLQLIYDGQGKEIIYKSRSYIEERSWDAGVDRVESVLLEIINEKNTFE
jgi:glycosyltransferase involved in cell wall biosynthesis